MPPASSTTTGLITSDRLVMSRCRRRLYSAERRANCESSVPVSSPTPIMRTIIDGKPPTWRIAEDTRSPRSSTWRMAMMRSR